MSRPRLWFRLKCFSLTAVIFLVGCQKFKAIEKDVCSNVILRNYHKCFEDDCEVFSVEVSRQEMIIDGTVVEVEAANFQIVDAFCGCERVFAVVSYLTEAGYRRSVVLVEPGDREIGRSSPSLTGLDELENELVEELECRVDGDEAVVLIRYYDPESDDLATMSFRIETPIGARL